MATDIPTWRPALRVCLFVLALCGSLNVLAAEQWVAVGADSERLAFSVDMGSVLRKGESVSFRERLVFTNPDQRDAVSGKLIKEKQALRVMRFNDRTQGVKSGTLFDENGRMIETVSVDDCLIHWLPIPPGSVAEREFDLVCDSMAATKPAAPR